VAHSSPGGAETYVGSAGVQLLDAIHDAVLVLRSGSVVHANRAALQLFGAEDAGQLYSLPLSELAPARDQRERLPALSGLAQDEVQALRIRTLDERCVDVELRLSTTQWEEGPAQLASLRPLGAADDTARAPRENHDKFKALVEAMPGVAYLCRNDESRSVLWLSPAVEELTGHCAQEFLEDRLSLVELCHPDDAAEASQLVDAALKAQQPFHLHYRLRNTDGSWRRIEEYGRGIWNDQGQLLHLVGELTDVSKRMRVEEEREAYRVRLQEARKLEGLGSLTGAIAHQFNNLLTSILGNTRLAQADLREGSRAQSCMEDVVSSVRHATRLTHRMLACSDDGALSLEPLDMGVLLFNHAELLRATLPEGVSLLVEDDADELWVEGAAGQLEECLASLVQNASEAYPAGHGKIWVRAGSESLDELSAQSLLPHRPLRAGEYAYVEVRDRGTGMSAEVQNCMFDPFFTTKFTGRGLGLAVCVGAARRHSGGFRVASTPDAGTSVRMYVPSSVLRPRRVTPPRDNAQSQIGGLVLVVDDEPAVRNIAAETLERAGFRPLLASDGEEALRIAREHEHELALVVLDRVMPGMSGEATLHELRIADAELPVLLISGYGGPGGIDERDVEFLQKPFGPHQLAARCTALARIAVKSGES